MKHQLLHQDRVRTFAVVFDTGDEVIEGLERFARAAGVTGAGFTAIGAFRRATLAFFDLEAREYLEIPVDEQVEVLTLAGNIGRHDGEPKIHAHGVLGRRDGSTVGGHLLRAEVRPTLEVVVTETPSHLLRVEDEETGLPLIRVGEGEAGG
jgi:uncharacterized protein